MNVHEDALLLAVQDLHRALNTHDHGHVYAPERVVDHMTRVRDALDDLQTGHAPGSVHVALHEAWLFGRTHEHHQVRAVCLRAGVVKSVLYAKALDAAARATGDEREQLRAEGRRL